MESGVIKEGRKHRSTRCFLSLWEKKGMATKNNKRQKKKNGASVQELLGIKAFTEYGIQTNRGELLFFKVRPTNISVLSQPSVETKIRQLTLAEHLRVFAHHYPHGAADLICDGRGQRQYRNV